jgi:colanic acid/amylovoran biosynthesis glycosyltransferase
MRILIFVETFMFPTLTFIYNEIKGLSENHEVKVLTTQRQHIESFPFPDVEVIPFEINRFKRRFRWELELRDISVNRKNKSYGQKLTRLVDTFNPDIIHGHFAYESLIVLENLKAVSVPVFISFHGYDASQLLSRKSYVAKLNETFRKLAVHPICVSRYMQNDLSKAGVDLSRGKLNYYGVDTNRFKRPEGTIHGDKFVFLQVSSIREKKGHIYTLRAFKKFLEKQKDKEKFQLVFAGGSGLLENMKMAAAEMGISPYVEFAGEVSHAQAYEYLSKADVFVHHSIVGENGDKEGIPNAIIEAMAMELPVISTYHSGIPELVEDGINGYLVKEKDVDTYAQRMSDILSWGKLQVNREKVIKTFSLQVHMKTLLGFYEEAIEKNK